MHKKRFSFAAQHLLRAVGFQRNRDDWYLKTCDLNVRIKPFKNSWVLSEQFGQSQQVWDQMMKTPVLLLRLSQLESVGPVWRKMRFDSTDPEVRALLDKTFKRGGSELEHLVKPDLNAD